MRIKVDNNKLYLLLIQNNISILPHIACALSESIKKSIFGFASVKLNFSFMLTFVFFQKITATWLPEAWNQILMRAGEPEWILQYLTSLKEGGMASIQQGTSNT